MQVEDPPARTVTPEVASIRIDAAPTNRDRLADIGTAFTRWRRGAVIRPVPITRAHLISGLKAAVIPFLVSRGLVWIATGFGAKNLQPPAAGLYSNLYPPSAIAQFFRWDADAYGYIAHHGYGLGAGGVAAEMVRVAWFPFYPLLIRLAGGSDWAMVIIPNVCFFASLALLY